MDQIELRAKNSSQHNFVAPFARKSTHQSPEETLNSSKNKIAPENCLQQSREIEKI